MRLVPIWITVYVVEILTMFPIFKKVHVSNLFWSREYNSAKEMCKYPSFSKVGGNYPLDLKIIWSSDCYYVVSSVENIYNVPVNLFQLKIPD
jgi:hypothetical protein